MTQAVDNALDPTQNAVAQVFIALEVVFPGIGTLRWLDGAGMVTFPDGRKFYGLGGQVNADGSPNELYGTLGAIQALTEGVATDAPRLMFEIRLGDLAAAAALCDPANQGSQVTLYFGVQDLATGTVLPDVETQFIGWMDVPQFLGGKNRMAVQCNVASPFEYLFIQDEGQRLNDAFHEAVFPGDLGLEFVVDVDQQLPWGADTTRPVVITRSTAYSGSAFGANVKLPSRGGG